MILNEKSLNKWAKSTFTILTAEQSHAILERFGNEPKPYEWSEQDIVIQIKNYLACGEFVKSIQDNGNSSPLPIGVDF